MVDLIRDSSLFKKKNPPHMTHESMACRESETAAMEDFLKDQVYPGNMGDLGTRECFKKTPDVRNNRTGDGAMGHNKGS